MNNLLPPEKRQHITEVVKDLLSGYENNQTPLYLLHRIAEDNNIEILEADLYEISGALRKEKDSWKIYVNREDSNPRKLFTIAHELGHYFLHRDKDTEFVDSLVMNRHEATKYAEVELEANEFAGSLIMPESIIRQRINQQTLTEQVVLELAREFNVSALAMATRLRNLDYDVPGFKSSAR